MADAPSLWFHPYCSALSPLHLGCVSFLCCRHKKQLLVLALPSLDQVWPPAAQWHFYAQHSPKKDLCALFLGRVMLGEGLCTSAPRKPCSSGPWEVPHLSWYNCHYTENLVCATVCMGVAFGMGSSSGQRDGPSASICVTDRNLSLQAVSPLNPKATC